MKYGVALIRSCSPRSLRGDDTVAEVIDKDAMDDGGSRFSMLTMNGEHHLIASGGRLRNESGKMEAVSGRSKQPSSAISRAFLFGSCIASYAKRRIQAKNNTCHGLVRPRRRLNPGQASLGSIICACASRTDGSQGPCRHRRIGRWRCACGISFVRSFARSLAPSSPQISDFVVK